MNHQILGKNLELNKHTVKHKTSFFHLVKYLIRR